MMFAQTCHRQVSDEDEVASFLGEAAFEVAGGVFGEAGEELGVGRGDPFWCLDEALSIGVLADG